MAFQPERGVGMKMRTEKKGFAGRLAAVVLVLCMCFSMEMPAYGASCSTYTDRDALVKKMDDVYAAWNRSEYAGNLGKSYSGAFQCAAFARYMFNRTYGHTDGLSNANVVKNIATFHTVADAQAFITKNARVGDNIRISSATGKNDTYGSETVTHIFTVRSMEGGQVSLYESNYGQKNKARKVTRNYTQLINACVNKPRYSASRKCSGGRIVNASGRQAYIVVKILHSAYNQTGTLGVNPSVTLSKTSMVLTEGESQWLFAVTTPADMKVSWRSSNSSVAMVANGLVTARSAGLATITATMNYGGHVYTKGCSVTVNAVQSVTPQKPQPETPVKPETPTQPQNTTYTGYIKGTDGSLAINRTPSTQYMIGEIPECAPCTVYTDKRSGNWVWVSYNGISGYSYSTYITTVKPASRTGTIRGTDGSLAINRTPSTRYQIGAIPEGQTCTVFTGRRSGNWVWVCYNGIYGYAYSTYIK